MTIPDVLDQLPKLPGDEIPLVGGLYYLFLTGEVPTFNDAMEVEEEWKKRSEVPAFVFDALRTMPRDAHPMMLFSQAILALQYQSVFFKRYHEGMKKEEYWVPMLEDSLNLTAKLPSIAAFIYSMKYKDGNFIPPDQKLDWGANFAHMMGVPIKNIEISPDYISSFTQIMKVGTPAHMRRIWQAQHFLISTTHFLPELTAWRDLCTAWQIRNVWTGFSKSGNASMVYRVRRKSSSLPGTHLKVVR